MPDSQLVILSSILIASLIGSPHCVAMCGGFTSIAAGNSALKAIPRSAAYHLGRLITYLVAGIGASQLGAFVSPVYVGAILLGSGLLLLFKVKPIPASVHRGMTHVYRNLIRRFDKRSLVFPLIVGLASTLLPCGWLYLYIGISAASPTPILTMVFFWLGTLPILTAWSAASGWILNATGRFFPSFRAALLIVAGIFSIFQHAPLQLGASGTNTCAHHHH